MAKTFYPEAQCLACPMFGQLYAISLCVNCYQRTVARQRRAKQSVRFNPFGRGIVYMITSPWIPGLVKIGSTRQQDIAKRVASSSIPAPHVAAEWREDPPWALEARLHAVLHTKRVAGMEWFQAEVTDVVALVDQWMLQKS